ncbi:hypothetical protein BO94DRAFT_590604 [Aspergillus sclerotioniger CBS 115572]|uniref:Uncharacterized protein n=1 Tax=Aspergillus sclerotioniger CBS 115572 TaxID=1450535 RepID=A0A317V4J8_9EURO|nr:hypothetical protein BO94DRAFT_590604 [Aspergillus sclerotioniger CBS 115572]PWY69025.1 hypothetical protein BO94DRAFT_590604 [Aspergillus sclerotioniger CBS 115572]
MIGIAIIQDLVICHSSAIEFDERCIYISHICPHLRGKQKSGIVRTEVDLCTPPEPPHSSHPEVRVPDLGDKMTDYDTLISNPQAIRYVAEFMLQTGLLGQFSQVELDPDPDPLEDPDHCHEHTGLRALGIDAEDAG